MPVPELSNLGDFCFSRLANTPINFRWIALLDKQNPIHLPFKTVSDRAHLTRKLSLRDCITTCLAVLNSSCMRMLLSLTSKQFDHLAPGIAAPEWRLS